jgi:hypothetical protein
MDKALDADVDAWKAASRRVLVVDPDDNSYSCCAFWLNTQSPKNHFEFLP